MGVIFLEHPNGQRYFCCGNCNYTPLTNRSDLMSTRFTGSTGRAYLFKKVCNVRHLKAERRMMITGQHSVCDVVCKQCDAKLGWFYEFAEELDQKYKEGHYILERQLIVERHGPADPADNALDNPNDMYM